MPAEPTESPERKVIAVVDGNSLLHRAFHAIPPTMSAPDGRPTGAVFGFVSMLLKLVEEFHPDGLVCAFDKGKPQRRIALLAQYKAQRPPMDPLLSEQFPMVHDLLGAMGVPVFEEQGWEGDDILGTLAAQGEEMGCDMLLVSGDRDVYQLATDHVRVVNTKKGLSDVVVFDPKGVAELYDGVTPALIPDYYGLKGDTSDNIPGVPGIGPKKASALINRYGSLDEVLAHDGEIAGKMGESIRAHEQDALVSRRLATIERTAPVRLDPDAAAWPSFHVEELRRALDGLGFNALARRVLSYAGEDAAQGGAQAAGRPLPAVADPVEGDDAMAALERAADEGAWVGLVRAGADDAPAGQGTLFDGLGEEQAFVALSSGWVVDGRGLPSAARSGDTPPGPRSEGPSEGHPSQELARVLRFVGAGQVERALETLYTRGRVVSFDTKADLQRLVPVDSSRPELIELGDVVPANAFDIGIACYLLDSERGEYDPSVLTSELMPFDLPAPSPADAGGASATERTRRDAEALAVRAATALALREVLLGRMEDHEALECFQRIEMPLVPVLVRLERSGMTVSRDRLASLSEELSGELARLRSTIYDEAGEEFNIDSPMQLSHVLFDEDKKVRIPVTRGMKKTHRGYISTNAKMLQELAADYPIVEHVLEYREKAKIKSTYLDALPPVVDGYGDGRLHTTYNQTVTATGRLSSSDPNLQNIPIRSELGRMVRAAFIPEDPETSCILGCDYSQIELRLLAHLSGDQGLIDAFTQGEDFHRETAARVFGVDPGDVTPEMRSRAKAVNFGIVYGQQAYGLSTSLKITMAEAQEMIDRYFIQFPRVRAYLDELVDYAHAHGFVSTMFGRRRYVPDVYSRNPNLRSFGERTAMNHPMQGSAADIIKMAMTRVDERMRREGFRARMIVQVHDELDFDCPFEEVDDLSKVVSEEMTGIVRLKVPLVVSCQTGATWADAH
ncbi:MAG: DNA polymerase I [Coriobacteriales bacterium]|jgi:DNA polymerase-1